ncbi:Penicillin-binding protein 2 (PBP-2) [Methylophaga frappieri]|uniref:Peptidoglycan D,D-transpeptidase MrdA n=1 Tax=Methylophaga frappieri (strain ATCC BAA-2434 / DSM 25690 / JAM7) TaxID=754477 RepID=I1YHD7_METFJ|nr:penicillin-binding protein 2 [Methylophaga frappieri]AFJ02330.1 Penicillin-binding protein 2 (PBP-2) [Methylophaga frappieri]
MAINTHLTMKDHLRERRLVNARLVFAAIFSVLLFLGIFVRLVVLQVMEYEHFDSLANKNRVDIEPLPPQRGLIYDRNGVVLAENMPTFSLELVPEKVPDMPATLTALQELFSVDADELSKFQERLQQQRSFEPVTLRYQLTEDEVARFSVNRHRFPGVEVVGRLIRHYPQGALFAHAIGYVGRINQQDLQVIDTQNYKGTLQIGKTGVEKQYEDLLHGKVGYRQVETNVQGRTVRELTSQASIPGRDIYLHLDTTLQRTAAKALAGYNGSIVAMDPRNGGILAMVSQPDFDPNLFVSGISIKDYAALRDSPERPLYDRSIRGHYPPGSTLKPFVALTGLELGVVSRNSETYCPGWYSLPGHSHRYRCWKHQGHGHTNVIEAMAESCDVYFYDLAHALGIDRMHDFMSQFGFGQRSGVDIPNESKGLLPSSQWKRSSRNQAWYPGETLISGIGQGFNQTTPLQLAHATAILAMRGMVQPPQLVRGSRENGQSALELMANEQGQSVPVQSPENWQMVVDAMVEVVHGKRGTAKHIGEGMPFKIAGKTGTAQVFGIAQDEKYDAETIAKKLHDHALFIAFAPADNPEFVVAVVVENGGSGSQKAAPMAKTMIEQYFNLNQQNEDLPADTQPEAETEGESDA